MANQPGGERVTRNPADDNCGEWKVIRKTWLKAKGGGQGQFVDSFACVGAGQLCLAYFDTAARLAGGGIDKFILKRPDGTVALEYSPPSLRTY